MVRGGRYWRSTRAITMASAYPCTLEKLRRAVTESVKLSDYGDDKMYNYS